MTRYGYARVSTREQNPDSQFDALTVAGVAPENVVIEKISGTALLPREARRAAGALQAGDQVTVTRLRRIGRNALSDIFKTMDPHHQHLLYLAKWFEEHEVDFVVLEQGIDTSTPIGRMFFRFMAAMAEFDREAIVEAPSKAWRLRGPAAGSAAARPS